MKYFLTLFIFLSIVLSSCNKNEEMKHEQNEESASLGDGAYGFVKIDSENAISLEELSRIILESETAIETKSSGVITKVCQHSGCWVTVEMPKGEALLVEFKDEFAIPKTGVVGKTIFFHGKGQKETYSIDELKDMAKKDGKSQEEIDQIIQPEYDIKFVADGVLIK